MSNITPYQASKVVNEWLKNDGIEKVLPPQMFYNYTAARIAKGKTPLIPCFQDEATGKVTLTTEGLEAWYETYSKKAKALAAL